MKITHPITHPEGNNTLNRSKYFYRTVVFAKSGEKVSLVDLNNPEEESPPLDPWLGVAVTLADGQHTIQQLIDYLANHYQGPPPDNLGKTIDSVIKRLNEADAIRLADEPVDLPYYLTLPLDKLDIERAKKQMADDGFRHQRPDLDETGPSGENQ